MPCEFEVMDFEKVHFIGIGGIGMSGIASVAKARGMKVSGSDLKESKVSKALRDQGIDVSIGHSAECISKASPDVVVVSSAIPERNPELKAAREAGIPVWPRAKMLAYVCRDQKVLAAAGTHGKTTTSSVLASAMVKLGADPSFLVGGIIEECNTNARFGHGDACVIEADESDGSFVYVSPYIAIVTNIEEDHLDHYADLDAIRSAFADFLSALPKDGCAVVCADCDGVVELAKSATECAVVSYGFAKDADVVVRPNADGSFIASVDGNDVSVKLGSNPGRHNMLNATAVLISLVKMGYSADDAAEAIGAFTGVRRRFDLVGKHNDITIIDDYGHHPTEIAATLKAAKDVAAKRVHVLFQPHRYSRTQALAAQFGTAFADADTVVIMDVYSAGETPIPGVTGKTVADSVSASEPGKQARWIDSRTDIIDHFVNLLEPGDMLITMGAGDVTTMGPLILEAIQGADE